MNLLTKQKEIHRLREWTCGSQVEGIVREFRMDTYTLLYFKWITNCIAHGTLLSVTWQPGWEGSLGEDGYMSVYGWVPSLFTWNYHDIISYTPIQNRVYKEKTKKHRAFQKDLCRWTEMLSPYLYWVRHFKSCFWRGFHNYNSLVFKATNFSNILICNIS